MRAAAGCEAAQDWSEISGSCRVNVGEFRNLYSRSYAANDGYPGSEPSRTRGLMTTERLLLLWTNSTNRPSAV